MSGFGRNPLLPLPVLFHPPFIRRPSHSLSSCHPAEPALSEAEWGICCCVACPLFRPPELSSSRPKPLTTCKQTCGEIRLPLPFLLSSPQGICCCRCLTSVPPPVDRSQVAHPCSYNQSRGWPILCGLIAKGGLFATREPLSPHPTQKRRHLNRSNRRSHRLLHSGETTAFRSCFCRRCCRVAVVAVAVAVAFSRRFAVAFAVAVPFLLFLR
jgi:hypothetical protein